MHFKYDVRVKSLIKCKIIEYWLVRIPNSKAVSQIHSITDFRHHGKCEYIYTIQSIFSFVSERATAYYVRRYWSNMSNEVSFKDFISILINLSKQENV